MPMNKFQAMTRIMAILREGGHLKPGTPAYKMVREMDTEKIEMIGLEAALAQIRKEKPHYLDQVGILKNCRTTQSITDLNFGMIPPAKDS
jgi:hypothetical protein